MATVKVFPTPKNPNPNGNVWPLLAFVNQVKAMYDGLPSDERDSAVISGVDGVTITYTHALSESEVNTERVKIFAEKINEAVNNNKGLSKKELDDILALIAAVQQ